MSGIGAKLSKHVLGMKFMRKTKDQVDKEKVEKVHREHFAPTTSVRTDDDIQINHPEISSTTAAVIEELWSYNQCKKYIFGRQSYGGFNPTVENNVKKGIWKPFYLDEAATLQSDSEDEEGKKEQQDVDVSDEEMAKTFGSLVGTLAKHFQRKHKKEPVSEEEGEDDDAGSNVDNKNKFKQKKNWKQKFQANKNRGRESNHSNQQNEGNTNQQGHGQMKKTRRGSGRGSEKKRQRESTGSTGYNQRRQSSNQPKKSPFSTPSLRQDDAAPPNKKRKFMKPSDD